MASGNLSLSTIGAKGSRIMYGFAIIALGIFVFVVSNGIQYFNTLLRPDPTFSVGTWALLIFGAAYIGFYPFYRRNAMWVMGLIWGSVELTYNSQLIFIHRMGAPPNLDNPVWNVYMLAVSTLFLTSILALRSAVKMDRRGLSLVVPILLFLPIFNVLGSLGVLELPVYLNRSGSIGFDLVVVSCVLLITKSAMHPLATQTKPEPLQVSVEHPEIAVIIPSLGRPSLDATVAAVRHDTSGVYVVTGEKPVLQIHNLASSLVEDFVAIVDDDALPPPGWLPKAASFFKDPKVAYACGPLIDPARRYPQLVQESFLGSFIMRDRYKLSKTGVVDELHVHGMGLYRRAPFVEALQKLGDVDMPAWENKVVTLLGEAGWKVVRSDALASSHPSRSGLMEFFRQKVKEGRGRGSYFRTFPRQVLKKPFFLLPLASVVILFVWPLNLFCLGVYAAEAIGTCRSVKPFPWFVANHVGYTLGLVEGLVR